MALTQEIERLGSLYLDQAKDDIDDEALDSFLYNVRYKIENLKEKGLVDEWGVLVLDETDLITRHFAFYDGSRKGGKRIVKLYKKALRIRKDISFRKALNRLIKNLKRKLEQNEFIYMIVVKDLDKYHHINMFYVKSQDAGILEKIENPFYWP